MCFIHSFIFSDFGYKMCYTSTALFAHILNLPDLKRAVLVRALLLEPLGIVTRSVLGNCLRINCVINFDQNTAGQNIDIPFLVLDVIWLDISMK